MRLSRKNKIKDPGFGYSSNEKEKSFIKSDGTSNIIHLNRPKNIDDLYTYLISISWLHFFGLVLLGFIVINSLFAIIYLSIGIETISVGSNTIWEDFLNSFFFSAQTITTVGYGVLSPNGLVAGAISSFQALIGLLSFSFITGLLYGRFSKPKSSVNFSDSLLLRKFEDERAIMFRLMSKRKQIMIEPEIKVTLSVSEKDESGIYNRTFFSLELERDSITYLPTIWTVVHKIDKDSPLYEYSNEEINELSAKLYILFQNHEESFSQKVYQIHSYDFKDLKLGYKFKKSTTFNSEGYTVIDHELLNKIEKL
jgi:inward rectifier potassium channel